MKREYTGYCKTCFKYGIVPKHFDERIHTLKCPLNHQAYLSQGSLEKAKTDLMLGKNEIFEQPMKIEREVK